jgi:transcriptional regulator GlxA family with amidase domain
MKHHVAILIFDDVEVLDFAGPFEVFTAADELRRQTAFTTYTVAETAGEIHCHNGLRVLPDYTFATCPPPDVLVVPGGFGTRALIQRPAAVAWLRTQAEPAGIVMSVCTGALVLARAGLLGGLRVTTHYEALDLLQTLEPRAIVDRGARFHDNGKILTAAGVSAGIDCALHVVARLLGPEAAGETARYIEYERHEN